MSERFAEQSIRARVLAVGAALGAGLYGCAGLAPPALPLLPPDAAEIKVFKARLDQAGFDSHIHRDWQRCLTELAGLESVARRSLEYHAGWVGNLAVCRSMAESPGDSLAARQRRIAIIDAAGQASRDFTARWSTPESWPAIHQVFSHAQLLHQADLAEEGQAVTEQFLQNRVLQLAREPGNTAVRNELRTAAGWLYGFWRMQAMIKRIHALFALHLGEHDPLTISTLRSLAYHEGFLGRPKEYLASMEKAWTLAQAHHSGNRMFLAGVNAEYAAALLANGRVGEALDQQRFTTEVIAEQQPTQHYSLLRVNYNAALMYIHAGDYAQAVVHARLSQRHALLEGSESAIQEGHFAAATEGLARLMAGDPEAPAFLRAALERCTPAEMHAGRHASALALHAARVGDRALLAWARNFLEQHMPRYRTPLHPDQAFAPLLRLWDSAGYAPADASAALPALARSLVPALTGRSPATAALAQFSAARTLAPADVDTAIWLYKRGANELQSLRTGLRAAEPASHQAWLAWHEDDLRSLIGALVDAGRLPEADQALRLLRDEEVEDFNRTARGRRGSPVRPLSYLPVEQLRNMQFDAVGAQALAAAQAADTRWDAIGTVSNRAFYSDQRAAAEHARLAGEVVALITPRTRGEAPASSQTQPVPARPLPAATARVVYLVREQTLDLLIQTSAGTQRVAVPVGRTEINRQVQTLRAALAGPRRDPLPAAQALHRWLLAPALPLLAAAGVQRIHVVPDASLRYVPFAALHDGQAWAVKRFSFVTELAGSTAENDHDNASHNDNENRRDGDSDPTPRAAAPGRLLALGRTLGDARHAALPGVAAEIDAVARGAGAAEVKRYLDADFTEARLRELLAEGAATVHLASHFVFDPAGEERSYLLLGDGQPLPLARLRAMRWAGVQLAVLSACESAIGAGTGTGTGAGTDRDRGATAGTGRELAGFASALHRAGVPDVLATLWRVEDDATARWMTSLYAAPPSAAGVARAQREWLAAQAGSSRAHPHYWAAFTWMSAR